jgi:LysM repeat protein
MKQSRYGFLFDLATTDYKGWAEGLKKAGYATNPMYPQLLITNIEKFNLAQYDVAPETETQKIEFQTKTQELSKTLFSINETQAYKAKEGDNIVSIALAFEMRIWQIKKYNDLDDSTEIHAGDTIYLKPKRNHAQVEFCKVGPRDNIRKISQRYAVKLKKIQEKNLLQEGEEPEIGETIYLQHEREQPPKLRIIKKRNKPVIIDPIPGLPLDSSKIENVNQPHDIQSKWHIVLQGETLFKIAKSYSFSVEQIIEWNHMVNNNIYPGQKLWLEAGH